MAHDSPGPSHPHLTTCSVGTVAGTTTTTTTTTTAAPSTAATRRDVAVATLPAPHSGPLERFGEVRQRSSLGHALSPWPTDSRAGAVSGLGEDRAGARGSALQAGAGVLPGGLPALGGQRPKAGRTSNAGKEVSARLTPHPSPLTPQSPTPLTPHPSPLNPQPLSPLSPLTPHPSPLTCQLAPLTPRLSPVNSHLSRTPPPSASPSPPCGRGGGA